MKIFEIANSIDPDGVAHYESLHLDLHCCPLVFVKPALNFLLNFADLLFFMCVFGVLGVNKAQLV